MKIRSQLYVVTFFAVLFFLLLAFILQIAIASKNKLFLLDSYKNLQTDAQKIIQYNSSRLNNFVFDNSYWGELAAAVERRDTNWLNLALKSSSGTPDADYVWLLDKEGQEAYCTSREGPSSVKYFSFTHAALLDSLHTKAFRHFFTIYNGKLTEIYTASIHPSTDPGRTTTPLGYFLAGKIMDTPYFNRMASLSNGIVFNTKQYNVQVEDTIDFKKVTVSYYLLLHDFFSKPVSSLKATRHIDVMAEYDTALKRYILYFLVGIVLVSLVFFQFSRIKLLNPLKILSSSLQQQNDTLLSSLKNNTNEYGSLARLVANFFRQNKILQDEVETRKQSEQALEKAAAELEHAIIEKIRAEQAHTAKSEFLSTMSHEIRTPINGLIGVINLLKDVPASAEVAEYVSVLNFSSHHLLSVVSDILDFSKIEAGDFKFEKTVFRLKDICRNTVQLLQPKAIEKKLIFNFTADDTIEEPLYGDYVRLSQIIFNLISNAIKFTNAGTIDFSYKKILETDTRYYILFTVADTGIGIKKQNIDIIFESFKQVNDDRYKYGGTGLGLTISKKLVEMQEGKIMVESSEGNGATFSFELFFDKVKKHTGATTADVLQPPGNKDLQGMKVLVAEDHAVNAMVLNRFLKKWNAHTTLVVNGKEAVDKLTEQPFDIVLMDIQMPVMNGNEAVRIIRQHSKIPIIALTADVTVQTKATIYNDGFNRYVTKPFNPDELYNILKQYKEKVHTQ